MRDNYCNANAPVNNAGNIQIQAVADSSQQNSSSFATLGEGTKLLPVVPVKMWTPNKKNCINLYAMTDPRFTESLCTSELLDSL